MKLVIQNVIRNILSITTDIVLMFGLWCCKMSYLLHLKARDLCVQGGKDMKAFKHEISVRTKLLDDNVLQLVIIDHDTKESWFDNIRFREGKKVTVTKVEPVTQATGEEASECVDTKDNASNSPTGGESDDEGSN